MLSIDSHDHFHGDELFASEVDAAAKSIVAAVDAGFITDTDVVGSFVRRQFGELLDMTVEFVESDSPLVRVLGAKAAGKTLAQKRFETLYGDPNFQS